MLRKIIIYYLLLNILSVTYQIIRNVMVDNKIYFPLIRIFKTTMQLGYLNNSTKLSKAVHILIKQKKHKIGKNSYIINFRE